MVDWNSAVRSWLMNDSAIADLVGDRIFWPMLPQGYDPAVSGLAITISTRGGMPDAEMPIVNPSLQIECWAPAGEGVRARALYGAVHDLMHGACGVDLGESGYILSCVEEVAGQDVVDPETKWATVLSFYRLMMRAN